MTNTQTCDCTGHSVVQINDHNTDYFLKEVSLYFFFVVRGKRGEGGGGGLHFIKNVICTQQVYLPVNHLIETFLVLLGDC